MRKFEIFSFLNSDLRYLQFENEILAFFGKSLIFESGVNWGKCDNFVITRDEKDWQVSLESAAPPLQM
jgi:hypothetical protein